MGRKMVSLKDISVACGVSIATVSKALNDHNDIGQETKIHIRQVAEKMGYFPNSAALALKTNRTNNLGVLFVDEARSGLTHDFYAHVLDSFKRAAENKGFDITFINSNKKRENWMSYMAHARYRGFDGIVIACVNFEDPDVNELIKGNIPVVTIDHVFNNRIAIVSDNIKGMRDIMEYVYKMGHRKIAYIHGMMSSVTNARLSSFYKTAEELGIHIPEEYVKEAAYRDTDATYLRTKELLELKDRPTCILFPDDFASIGGINAIREKGMRIPEDISVVGYDGIPIASKLVPRLTTIEQDTESLGRLAACKLIDLVTRPKTTLIEQTIVEGKLFIGDSVAKIES